MKSIGIDIGSYSIKIAEVESTKEGARLTHYKELKLSQDPAKDKSIEAIDYLITYFKKTEENTNLVLGLNQSNVIHRQLVFPFKERHNILKTIAFELEDEIPFSQDNAIFEAKITSYTENGATVLATACPKYQIEKLVQSSRDYSIKPQIISVEGLALTNLLEDWTGLPKNIKNIPENMPEKRKATAYLHIGHHKSIVAVYLDDCLIELRSVAWGSEQVAQKMSRKYSIPFSEAIKEVQNKGYILLDKAGATEDQQTYSEIIREAYHEFGQLFNLTLLDISSEHHININQLYLMGGASQTKNVGPYLTQQLNIATNIMPFPHANVQLATTEFNSVTGHIALGLAIEGLKKPRNPATNLLKGEFSVEANQLSIFWKKWAPTINMSFVFFIILCVYGYLKEDFTRTMADRSVDVMKKQAQSVSPELKGRKARIGNIKKYIKKENQKLKQKEQFQELQKVNSALDILKQVSNVTPNKKSLSFEIKRINIQGELVTLEGTTHIKSPLSSIKNSLQSLSSNKKVQSIKSNIKITSKSEKSFGYSFKVIRK